MHPNTNFLYQLIRPEAVRASEVPLSSDAGCKKFEVNNEAVRAEHVAAVRAVEKKLLTEVIPKLVERLEDQQRLARTGLGDQWSRR